MVTKKTATKRPTAKKTVKKTAMKKPGIQRRTDEEILAALGTDIYYVEVHDGHKIIHDLGYAYDSYDGTRTPYRIVEYTGAYIDPKKLRARGYEYYDEVTAAHTQYIKDVSRAEVLRYMKDLLNTPALPMKKVTDRTPVGYYISSPPFD